MIVKSLAVTVASVLVASANQAQTASTNIDQAIYVTCRQAHAMNPEARKALAMFLAEHAARYHGVVIPEDQRGAQVAYLVRGGCTLLADAHLFAVIDNADGSSAGAVVAGVVNCATAE